MPGFERRNRVDLEDVLRACYFEFGLGGQLPPGAGNEFVAALKQVNSKLDNLGTATAGAQAKINNIVSQLGAHSTSLDSLKAELDNVVGLLTSIQQLLVNVQSTGLSKEDAEGLAAGLAQLQNTNAVLKADAQP